MQKETMTVHKALSELKTLGARIDSKINSASFIAANKHSNTKINGIDIKDFKANAVDAYKSIRSLINRRNAIKRAVTQSNAVTKVTLDGVEYTVAEAIDKKNVGNEYLATLFSAISNQRETCQRVCDRKNGQELDERADQHIKSMFDNADTKNRSEEADKARQLFVASQTYELVDPIDSLKVLNELKDQMDKFSSEVDAALSVSNAVTTIEVEYETY